MRRVITGCRVILQPQLCGGSDCKYSMIWVNYNISLTWINAIWGWFPLSTMIPVRSQWGRYNLPRMIYSMYSNWPSCHTSQSIQDIEASCFAKSMSSMFGARWCQVPIGELVPKMNTWLKKQKKKTKADWQNMCVIRRGSRIRTCRPWKRSLRTEGDSKSPWKQCTTWAQEDQAWSIPHIWLVYRHFLHFIKVLFRTMLGHSYPFLDSTSEWAWLRGQERTEQLPSGCLT